MVTSPDNYIKRDKNGKIILAIDASSESTSVSISNGQRILVSKNEDNAGYRGTILLGLVEEVIESSGLNFEDIDVFAVTVGPGKFTGIRNSLSTIKAFSMSLNKPVVCVPTLQAIAHEAGPSSFTCSLLPANREDVFAQQFIVSDEGEINVLSEVRIMNIHKLLEDVQTIQSIKWTGKGSVIYSKEIVDFAIRIERDYLHSGKGLHKKANNFRGWFVGNQSGILSESVIAVANKMLNLNQKCMAKSVKASYGR